MYRGSAYTTIYNIGGREVKGDRVPVYRQGHPGTSERIDHRGEAESSRGDERQEIKKETREREKRISKIQQEPDTNTDYSRG